MNSDTPQISQIEVHVPTTLRVRWAGKRGADIVNLAGWIATGGDVLAPLKSPDVFRQARIGGHGRAVEWDDDDLAIDSYHLKLLADEQRPVSNNDIRLWQASLKISNAEAADLVGVSPSTWGTYRVDAEIPRAVGIVMRTALRDPLLLQAHLQPRKTGRPRKEA